MKNFKENFVDNVNTLVETALTGLTCVPLGPRYAEMSYADASTNLLIYRAKKHFQRPSDVDSSQRRLTTIEQNLTFDRKGPSLDLSATACMMGVDEYTRSQLYKTRQTIHDVLHRYFKFDVSKLRMPSGETLVPAKGDVSVAAKMRDVSQWCVTADCFDLAATVIYRTPALKQMARKHIGTISHEEMANLYFAFSNYRDVGYRVFRELLLTFVTIVEGARVSTVPKSNDIDRMISCEPMLNMIVQSVIEEGIRDCVKKEFNIDLRNSQFTHKAFTTYLENATIDLSNASNSNWFSTMEFLYPKFVFKLLEAARSPQLSDDDHAHALNMLAPMGNGFTFGVMTFTLLCAARQYDSFAHVFGDDIIIDRDVAPAFIDLLDVLGYKLNEEKTFMQGTFRESCGSFTSHGVPITTFKWEWATNNVEAIALVNKITVLSRVHKLAWLDKLSTSLLGITPSLWKKWVPSIDAELFYDDYASLSVTGNYVIITSNSQVRKLREDSEYRAFREAIMATKSVKRFLRESQIQNTNYYPYIEQTVSMQQYRSKPLDNVDRHWYAHYMYSGRCSAPTRVGQRYLTVTNSTRHFEFAFPKTNACNTHGEFPTLRTERLFSTYTRKLFSSLRD